MEERIGEVFVWKLWEWKRDCKRVREESRREFKRSVDRRTVAEVALRG